MVTRKQIGAALSAVTLVAAGVSRRQRSAKLQAYSAGPVDARVRPFEPMCVIDVSKNLRAGELSSGPRPPLAGAEPWRFCGTVDGVFECG